MAKRKPRLDPPAEAAAASLRYIESSALLAALLEHDAEAIQELRELGHRVTSALTCSEAARALIRARVTGRITPNQEQQALRALRLFERRIAVVAVTADILVRAGRPFPVEPVRTLDGVHLATVESLGEPPQLVTIITRDERVRANARALGYAVGV